MLRFEKCCILRGSFATDNVLTVFYDANVSLLGESPTITLGLPVCLPPGPAMHASSHAVLVHCHTRLSEENQVQTYMRARIKFHAYSDI
jgi:hypothetical protein